MTKTNNNIPKGYKNSPLGIIPEEWDALRMKDVCKVHQGLQIPISERFLEKVENADFYITNEFLKEGSKNKYYILNAPESAKCVENDVLMTRTGNTGRVVTNVKGAFHNNFFKIVYDANKISKDFLVYFLKDTKNQHKLLVLAGNSTIPDLNHSDFYSLGIQVPPLPEQQKIAEILSTWDVAIEKQQALIAQLLLRKRALMQKLLTGKLRLRSETGERFSGDWKKVKLGEVGEISSAGVDKTINDNEIPVRLLNYLDVYRRDFLYGKEFNHVVTAKREKIISCSVLKGDVFFTPSSEVPNDIANSAVAMEDMDNVVYSYHVVRFRLKEDWDLVFRGYAFKTEYFYRQAQRLCDGSGQRYVISQTNFRRMKTIIPPSIEEQTAIAEVLSTADRHIEIEQQKLAHLREQKKGLMQVLLSGRKRVRI